MGAGRRQDQAGLNENIIPRTFVCKIFSVMFFNNGADSFLSHTGQDEALKINFTFLFPL